MGSITSKSLFIGLDKSGKTSLLNYMANGANQPDPEPTKGFDEQEVKFSGVVFKIFDVSGAEKTRDLWKHYYEDVHACVYFVDSCDADRFEESKNCLEKALKEASFPTSCPILVVFSKSSKQGAKSLDEISKAMSLDSVLKSRDFKAFSCDSKDGKGITEAFKWLSKAVKQHHKKEHKKGGSHADH